MPDRLLEGLKRYQLEHLPHLRDHFARLAAEGQKPTTLFLGCCDSRLVPNLLTDSGPGEIFVVRNVGNFVPPFEHDDGYHGTSAAIEFGVMILKVTDIVICGHSDCGAIRALYEDASDSTPHITTWLQLGRAAMLEGEVNRELLTRTEQRSIVVQLEHLMSFPMVHERVAAGQLSLHGWYFDIATGEVLVLDIASGKFRRPE
jgi:carbonic anhydrase